MSNDGTHWRKERTDPWQERKTVDVDYRIDTSVEGRVKMFDDGVEKLLRPEKRNGWIKRTLTDCRVVDLKPLYERLLPGVLEDLLFEYLQERLAAEVDEYLKGKELTPEARAALRAQILGAASERLRQFRAQLQPQDLAALKQQLVALAKEDLLKAVGQAAGPQHQAALQAALEGLHMRYAAVADKLLKEQEALLTVPAGTPLNLYFNLGPAAVPYALKAHLKYRNDPRRLAEELLKLSDCPDLVEDRGHTYGADLTEQEKKDLTEFLKTL